MRHAAVILKLLVTRLRQAWPCRKIVFRAISGFCRELLLNWCDRHDVKYLVGIARNERLLALAAPLLKKAERAFARTQQTHRLGTAYDHTALTWSRVRWVIAKAEHTDTGSNPRFILTNSVGDAQRLYDRRYYQRLLRITIDGQRQSLTGNPLENPPPEIVQSIKVAEVFTPNMEADAVGGVINVNRETRC